MFELSIFLRDKLVGRSRFNVDEVRIGRAADNEVQIDNLALSRYHASIETIAGLHVLKDFGSQNGTYLNGEKVTGREGLSDGDRIQIGKFSIVFHAEKQAASDVGEIRDKAAYAVAGETIVTKAVPEVVSRPCPWAAYVEEPAKGKDAPRVHPLVSDVFVIGSDEGSDLVLAGAPPRGAALLRGWNGFSLLALGPGTARNGAPVALRSELRRGDVLTIGSATLKYNVGRPT